MEARDDQGLGNRNSVQVVINLEDINDNAPIFIQKEYESRIFENEIEFKDPLKVIARDADLNGKIYFGQKICKTSQVAYCT